jgi:hypothetical protein
MHGSLNVKYISRNRASYLTPCLLSGIIPNTPHNKWDKIQNNLYSPFIIFFYLFHGTGINSDYTGTNYWKVKVKVKCTLVHALRLCTGRTAHREGTGIALLFHDHGTRKSWGVTPRPLFTPGKDPVPTVEKDGWDSGPVWTRVENLAPTGIRSPDRPARSQSLYRLRYPAHNWKLANNKLEIYRRKRS